MHREVNGGGGVGRGIEGVRRCTGRSDILGVNKCREGISRCIGRSIDKLGLSRCIGRPGDV